MNKPFQDLVDSFVHAAEAAELARQEAEAADAGYAEAQTVYHATELKLIDKMKSTDIKILKHRRYSEDVILLGDDGALQIIKAAVADDIEEAANGQE
jgi:hypothetical protein